jgi:hypothetical protein
MWIILKILTYQIKATLQNNSEWQCEKAMVALSQDSPSRYVETNSLKGKIAQSLLRKGEGRKAVFSRNENHVRLQLYLAMRQKYLPIGMDTGESPVENLPSSRGPQRTRISVIAIREYGFFL